MVALHKIPLIWLVIAGIVSAIADDYSNHPITIRMRELKNLMNGFDDKQIRFEIVNFIQAELNRHMPTNYLGYEPISVGESLIAMLKLFATINNHWPEIINYQESNGKMYMETLNSLLIDSTVNHSEEIQNNLELAKYVLDWNTYVDLLDFLSAKNNHFEEEFELVCFTVMLVIENSSYLKHSFSNGMMYKLNRVRNKANAINTIYLSRNIQLHNIPLDVIRFYFVETMINRNLSKDSFSGLQLRRSLVKEEMANVFHIYNFYDNISMKERAATSFFTALLELPEIELLNHSHEVTIALGWFKKVLKSRALSMLGDILKLQIDGSIFQESDVIERIDVVKELPDWNFDIVEHPAKIDFISIECYKILLRTIKNSNVLSIHYQQKYEEIRKIFYNIGDMLLEPDELNDREQFDEYDKYHIELYESNESAFHSQREWMNSFIISNKLEANLNRAEELVKSIHREDGASTGLEWFHKTFSDKVMTLGTMVKYAIIGESNVDARNHLRIRVRYSLQYSNLFGSDMRSFETFAKKIVKLYIQLINYGLDVCTKDPELMKEWHLFTLIYPKIISNVLNDEIIKEIAHLRKNMVTSDNDSDDALLYVFLTNIARVMATTNHSSNANELIQRILELEQRIGNAETVPLFIQDRVLKEKQLFYIFYADKTIPFQTNLTQLVEHHVDLLTSAKDWFDPRIPLDRDIDLRDYARRNLLGAIYTATANDPNAVHNLIDPTGELRFKVNQLMNGYIRDFGMDDDFEELIWDCEPIYGQISP